MRPTNTLTCSGDFCITWDSLVGAHYIVQSTPLFVPPTWTDVTNITAIDVTTTWCTTMTGPMQFFRVIEGVSLAAAPISSVNISSVQFTPGGPVLTWFGPVGATFHVEWTDSLVPPVIWNQVATPITSGSGIFTFTDDGTQTAPLGPVRFYRLVQP